LKKKNDAVTLKDIAKEVGVSAMAVSKALNGKGGVSAATEKKIQEAVKRLGYRPNIIAKSLRLANTKTLGVVVSDSSHSFFASVIKGIEETAAREGYSIILCNTDQDHDKEKKAISVLINKRIDGMLLAASMLTRVEDADYLKRFGIPFVFVIRRSESDDVDYVINDNVTGAYLMTSHLISNGSQRIYFINLYKGSPSGEDRLIGYKKALKENNIEYSPELIQNVKPQIEEGYLAMKKLLAEEDDVSTVFCGCDVIAIGAIEAILETGRRVPEDIRVGAYDDIDFAAYLKVPLTTIRQPKYLLGEKATELLIEKIKTKNSVSKHIILDPELIIRRSG
jgi:DNA-binding LacI/PurR family transcriptional regulator